MSEYQTKDDKSRERIIANTYASHLNLELHEYKDRFAAIDFYLHNGKTIVEFVEVKCRPDIKHDKYLTAYVSFNKWMKLLIASESFGKSASILFWYGGDNMVRKLAVRDILLHSLCDLVIAGRNDRADAANDIEPMITVPIGLLKDLGTKVID